MKKLFSLLSLVVLLGISVNVMGADSATTPVVGSTHTYSVTGTSGNNISFTISTDLSNTSLVDETSTIFTPSSFPAGGSWTGNVYTVASAGTAQTFTVEWLTASAGNTYYLNITETNTTTLCLTTRQLTIVPETNTFEVYPVAINPTSTTDNDGDLINESGEKCSDVSGTIIPNSSSFGTTTTVVFEVRRTMTGGDPDWKFDWALASTGGTISSVTFATATGNNVTPTAVNASGTNVAIPLATTGDKETITVVVINQVAASTLTLTTSNGVSNDVYAIPDVNTGNNVSTVTLSSTPLVSTITAD